MEMTEINLRLASYDLSLDMTQLADSNMHAEEFYCWLTEDIDHDVRLACLRLAVKYVRQGGMVLDKARDFYERAHKQTLAE